MPRLSLSDRQELIKLHSHPVGLSNREIDQKLKCNEKTVRLTVQNQNTHRDNLDLAVFCKLHTGKIIP